MKERVDSMHRGIESREAVRVDWAEARLKDVECPWARDGTVVMTLRAI